MVVQRFCASGESEAIKGSVHGAACVIVAAMAAYNIAAWHFRHQTHLGVNAVVYSLAVVWEMKQTVRHLRRCAPVATQTAEAA
jgi:hypothetical protein